MTNRRRRRQMQNVSPGDGHRLPRFHWWQMLWRSMFWLRLPTAETATVRREAEEYAVVVDYFDSSSEDGNYVAQLYCNGRHHAQAELPTAFPVTGGVIEVAATMTGLKRIRYVPEGARSNEGWLLTPEPRSAEGLRAHLAERNPQLSFWLGWIAVVVLIATLLLGIPQLVETVTSVPWVTEHIGVFASPVQLPDWINATMTFAAILAGIERALTVRYHWLIDGDLGNFDVDL